MLGKFEVRTQRSFVFNDDDYPCARRLYSHSVLVACLRSSVHTYMGSLRWLWVRYVNSILAIYSLPTVYLHYQAGAIPFFAPRTLLISKLSTGSTQAASCPREDTDYQLRGVPVRGWSPLIFINDSLLPRHVILLPSNTYGGRLARRYPRLNCVLDSIRRAMHSRYVCYYVVRRLLPSNPTLRLTTWTVQTLSHDLSSVALNPVIIDVSHHRYLYIVSYSHDHYWTTFAALTIGWRTIWSCRHWMGEVKSGSCARRGGDGTVLYVLCL